MLEEAKTSVKIDDDHFIKLQLRSRLMYRWYNSDNKKQIQSFVEGILFFSVLTLQFIFLFSKGFLLRNGLILTAYNPGRSLSYWMVISEFKKNYCIYSGSWYMFNSNIYTHLANYVTHFVFSNSIFYCYYNGIISKIITNFLNSP